MFFLFCSREYFLVISSYVAGVGKSHVITSVVQGFERFCSSRQNSSPDDLNVLVTAPTGKAAFNVFGVTLHSAFKLPANQATSFHKLSESDANTLRLKFAKLKLIIIDEISMVSYIQLQQVDDRLRQIFQTDNDFGGISVLAVGHLRY